MTYQIADTTAPMIGTSRENFPLTKMIFRPGERSFNDDEIVEPRPHAAEVVGEVSHLELVVLDEEVLRREVQRLDCLLALSP